MSVLDRLQLALAGEHAAIYGYGVVGGRLTSQSGRALTNLNAHRSARDQLSRLIVSKGAEPVPADPFYAVDISAGTQKQLVTTAIAIEDRLSVLYAELMLEKDASARGIAVEQLQGCAVRATQWRGRAQAFPGLSQVAPTN